MLWLRERMRHRRSHYEYQRELYERFAPGGNRTSVRRKIVHIFNTESVNLEY